MEEEEAILKEFVPRSLAVVSTRRYHKRRTRAVNDGKDSTLFFCFESDPRCSFLLVEFNFLMFHFYSHTKETKNTFL